jgi:hypothetical protein
MCFVHYGAVAINYCGAVVMYSLPSSLGGTPDPTHKNEQTTVPSLPRHPDKLIDQPWSKEASLLVDWRLWYTQQEFELVGGKP